MKPEGSLPHSQVPDTFPYPEPDQSSPCLHVPLPEKSTLILSSHLRVGLPSGLFPSGFPTKTLPKPLLSRIRATCPAHLILLDLISRTILNYSVNNHCYLLNPVPIKYTTQWSIKNRRCLSNACNHKLWHI
jgi:hypothetical protein